MPVWPFDRANPVLGSPSVAGMIEQRAADQQRDRIKRIGRQWDAYQGKLPPVLRTEPGEPDDNVSVALSRERCKRLRGVIANWRETQQSG